MATDLALTIAGVTVFVMALIVLAIAQIDQRSQ